MRRRAFLWSLAAALPARSLAAAPTSAVFPLSIAVAADPEPVVADCWLDQQVREAERLLANQGVHVAWAERRQLPASAAMLETADDRDDLAAHVRPAVVNVFVVRSLRDVDDPSRTRMGVRWRLRRDLRRDYVIVSSRAVPSVLAHELGHYFGNGHSTVVDNVMSYRRRDRRQLTFDTRQGRVMRQTAHRLLARGRVTALPADADTIEPEGCRAPGDYWP